MSPEAQYPQRPTELFGRATELKCPGDSHWLNLKQEDPRNPYKEFPCPYTTKSCIKIRKAKPNPLIGNCTVMINSARGKMNWMVCPKRFNQCDTIFRECSELVQNPTGSALVLTNEIAIGEAGRLDFGLHSLQDEEIFDFVGIEVQAMGTTSSGPIWDARNDYLSGSLKSHYRYGVNLKDASKKILVQMLHKGRQLSRMHKKYVLVIQDGLLEHLLERYDLSSFREADSGDFVHIHAYSLVKEGESSYGLQLSKKLSSDGVDLPRILDSNPSLPRYTFSDVQGKLKKKVESGSSRPIS